MSRNDREWMYQRRLLGGGLQPTFVNGVNQFLDFAFEHANAIREVTIWCPCDKCTNRYMGSCEDVLRHLYYNGFMTNYYLWRMHSEVENCNEADQVLPNPSAFGEAGGVFREMFVDLADGYMATHAYTSTEPNIEAKEFFDLLENEKECLYNGCDVSSLQAIAKLLHIKSSRNVSGLAFDDMCATFKEWLPDDNKFPGSFAASKKLMNNLGLKWKKIHACSNDCMLFYKDAENLSACSTCGLSRYANSVGGSTSKRVPRKVLRYLPLIPRLQRLFMSRKTVEYMIWHKFNTPLEGSMTHPCHGQAWRHFDEIFSDFSSDP